MKKSILTLAFILFTSLCFAQKIYVWCPESFDVKPRKGLLDRDTVDLIIFDGRVLTKTKKIECSSEQLSQALFNQIKASYPSIIFKLLPEDSYYKKNNSSHNTFIKIGISAYQAGFGTDVTTGVAFGSTGLSGVVFAKGMWNAITSYSVKIGNGDQNDSKDIYHTASRSNIGGYSSARKALKESYLQSGQDLLFFIDSQLTK